MKLKFKSSKHSAAGDLTKIGCQKNNTITVRRKKIQQTELVLNNYNSGNQIDIVNFINLVLTTSKSVVPLSEIAEATCSSSSPEFPMHVVQPYPTI